MSREDEDDDFVRDSTHEEFTHELRGQNDYLWRQLDALRKASRSTWRRHRLHEVVCAGCDRSVVEVMDTRPYPIVLHRRLDMSAAEASPGSQAWRGHRKGGWQWFPISNPPPDADSKQARCTILPTVCDCRQMTLSLGGIFDSLRSGEPKRVLPRDTLS